MATSIGQAYVQIIPSAQGIKGALTSELNGEAASAGTSAGSLIGSKIKGAIGAAAIGTTLLNAIKQGAALEQSLGGIETLFKDHANIVTTNAANAWKTAGLSANAYMEQATSFSASLLQSLGGDTQKAAKYADMAIIDMSDNANKMGTSIDMIQNAYQGFAKQNYTMLDNLKLGYGGTKTEMQRLLADAEKISGVHYDISNLSDVYQAIHVIQGELGITGTTALEAASTLEGSFNSMKATFQNFMAVLVTGGDVSGVMQTLVESVNTFVAGNLVPAIENIAVGLVSSLPNILAIVPALLDSLTTMLVDGLSKIGDILPGVLAGIFEQLGSIVSSVVDLAPAILNAIWSLEAQIVEQLPEILQSLLDQLPILVENIISSIQEWIPVLVETSLSMLTAFTEAIPQVAQVLTNSLPVIINSLVSGIASAAPTILTAAIDLLMGLVRAIPQIAIALVQNLPTLITTTVTSLLSNVPLILKTAVELLWGLIKAIPMVAWELLSSAGDLVVALVDGLMSGFGAIFDVGAYLLEGLWDGISSGLDWLFGKISDLCDTIIGWFTDFFDIGSPSKRMAREVGKFLPPGVVVGAQKEMPKLNDKLDEMLAFHGKVDFGINDIAQDAQIAELSSDIGNYNSNVQAQNNLIIDYNKLAEIMVKAMSQAQMVTITNIDGEQVAKTTAPLINERLEQISRRENRKVGVR